MSDTNHHAYILVTKMVTTNLIREEHGIRMVKVEVVYVNENHVPISLFVLKQILLSSNHKIPDKSHNKPIIDNDERILP